MFAKITLILYLCAVRMIQGAGSPLILCNKARQNEHFRYKRCNRR